MGESFRWAQAVRLIEHPNRMRWDDDDDDDDDRGYWVAEGEGLLVVSGQPASREEGRFSS